MEDGDYVRDKTLFTDGVEHLPLPRGRYKVGCADVLNGTTRDRGVLFRVFYPCNESAHICPRSANRTPWLPAPEKKYADGYARTRGSLAYAAHRILGSPLGPLFIPATTGACPARENRNAFPVVLFSHDIGECRTTSSSLCVELASHGCVVAAIEHRDNTACRTFYVERIPLGKQYGTDITDGTATANSDSFVAGHEAADLEREETDQPLASEEEVPMCESTLEEDEEDDIDSDDDQKQTRCKLSPNKGSLNDSYDELDTAAKFRLKASGVSRVVWVNYRSIEKTPSLYNIRLRQLHRRVAELIRALNCLDRINSRRTCRNELPVSLLATAVAVNSFESISRPPGQQTGHDAAPGSLVGGHVFEEATAALAGLMDLSRVTVAGRGFGGATAYMTLQMEERTVCGAAIDPLMFVIQADRPIDVCRPLLLVLNGRHTAREDVRIMRTMFRKTYTTAYTLLGSDAIGQCDLPFVRRRPSLWSSLSLSWPMVAPGSFTSLDLGSSLLLRFMADKCNFGLATPAAATPSDDRRGSGGGSRQPFEEFVRRKAGLIEEGVRMPARLFSRYSNAR